MDSENPLELLALATIFQLTPTIVQKKILFKIMNMINVKLNEKELSAIEHKYAEKPDCGSIGFLKAWSMNYQDWGKSTLDTKMQELMKTCEELQDGTYH